MRHKRMIDMTPEEVNKDLMWCAVILSVLFTAIVLLIAFRVPIMGLLG